MFEFLLTKNVDFLPALNIEFETSHQPTSVISDIKDILNNGFMWYCPTPKHRTSAEKK